MLYYSLLNFSLSLFYGLCVYSQSYNIYIFSYFYDYDFLIVWLTYFKTVALHISVIALC